MVGSPSSSHGEGESVNIDRDRDLFVQALISFQQAPEDDWFSYYQIAGITTVSSA